MSQHYTKKSSRRQEKNEIIDSFRLKNVIERAKRINQDIRKKIESKPPHTTWKSTYQYQPDQIIKQRRHKFNERDFLFATLDFSLLAVPLYKKYHGNGRIPYDPASMLALWFSFFQHKYPTVEDVHQLLNGTTGFARTIRQYCGFDNDFPSYSALLDFVTNRLTSEILEEILQIMVKIYINLLGIKDNETFVCSVDGHNYASFAKYRGCNRYQCHKCSKLPLTTLNSAGDNLRHLLQESPQNVYTDRPYNLYISCPFTEFLKDSDRKPPRSTKFGTIHLEKGDMTTLYPDQCSDDATPEVKLAYHLNLVSQLNAYQLRLKLDDYPDDALDDNGNWQPFACKRIPSDGESRMGVKGGDKPEYVFGADTVTMTAYFARLNLELPIAAVVLFGSDDESQMIPVLSEQVKQTLGLEKLGERITAIMTDARWDHKDHYQFCLDEGVAPVCGINRRGQMKERLIRGHRIDIETRQPRATCGLLMQPHGSERKRGRVTYTCGKQCEKCVNNTDHDCPFLETKYGQVAHFCVKDDPMIFTIPLRGSVTERELKKLRPGSERLNSMFKNISGDRCLLHTAMGLLNVCLSTVIMILVRKVYLFLRKIWKRLSKLAKQHLPFHLLKIVKKVPGYLKRYFFVRVPDT